MYLGTVFAENGLQCYVVDVRAEMTMSRCGKLYNLDHSMGHSDNLLMDVPPHESIDDLRSIANDRDKWRALVRQL